ncbi:MAG TPA: efflux RND transporter permease subunit, partial [Bacteroidetes bacterium]|nr:efflux RND transporter permease subunit [Bacteroidota bacterium]
PEINFPTVMVQTVYPGNPPVDIENLITRPIEKEVESLKGIKKMTSLSSQDVSGIFIEFQPNVDINKALQDVKDAVDKAKNDLPDDLREDPSVTDIDLSEFPVVNINLSGDFNVNELKEYAEELKDEIETIYEVSKVNITGITDREVRINLNPFKMSALKVSYTDVENAVKRENVSMSGGDIKMGKIRRTIRLVGEFKHPSEIDNIIVKSEKGNIVYMRDIGSVEFGFADRDSYARLNNQPVVSLQVIKKSGENLLSTIAQVNKILKKAQNDNTLPEKLVVTITNDQSKTVKLQLSNLENSIIMGMIFVIIILFLFLGTRNSLIVGLAIPMSMFLSFLVMGLLGYNINMIVLFALILALGMLVDNAIVVTENMFRYVQRGYSRMEAARQATGEVAVPIISSTATTLAAFVPLLFWDSTIGKFMSYLPETLIIVLTSSLVVALVIVPVVFNDFYKKGANVVLPKRRKHLIAIIILVLLAMIFFALKVNWMGTLLLAFAFIGLLDLLFLSRLALWFQKVGLVWLENTYLKFVTFALKGKNPYLLIAGTFVLMIVTMVFYFNSNPNIVFFPQPDPKLINIVTEMPINTDIDVTDSAMKVIEKKVFAVLKPDMKIVNSVLTTVGKGAVGENAGFGGRTGGSNKGLITINFVEYEDRGGISTRKIQHDLEKNLVGQYPGIIISVEGQKHGPPTGKPINLEIHGKDFRTLLFLSDTIRSVINAAGIPGIEALKIDLDVGKPELLVNINREKARRYGLSTSQIGDAIRTALFGKEISDFKQGEDEYKIRMKLADKYRYNLEDLINQRITFRSQASGKIIQVPISAVADFTYSSTYGAIKRIDRDRVVTIYSNVLEGYNANNINVELKKIMGQFKLPAGVTYKFTGEQ